MTQMTAENIHRQIQVLGFAEIVGKHCKLSIEPRPHYCDRGRYIVKVFVTGTAEQLFVDEADGFPRYYFGFEAMRSEIEAWMKARNQ